MGDTKYQKSSKAFMNLLIIPGVIIFDIVVSGVFSSHLSNRGSNVLTLLLLFITLAAIAFSIVRTLIVLTKFYDEDSPIIGFVRFTFEDIVSPIYNIFQFVGGFIASKLGNDVNWPGCIWDVVWTLIWGGFIFWGLATQIK